MGQTVCFWPLEAVQLGYNPTHIGCNAAWTPAGLQTFVGVFRGIIDSGGESFSLEKAGNAEKDGASGGIRTHDPCLRRAVLYPAELRMRCAGESYASCRGASMPGGQVVSLRQGLQ